MHLFEGRKLTCIRGERMVFQDLDFAVPEGGALTLVGPNGSGKSSLLRVLAGLLAPAAGEVVWRGAPVAGDPEAYRREMRYLGHANAVKPVLSVAENVAFWAGLESADGERVAGALEGFDLTALAEIPGRLLSSGQRRRVALARLLAGPAGLWLLDEPTVGLDRASQGRLEQAIARMREAGGAVIAATHTPLALGATATLALDDFAPRGTAIAHDEEEELW
jgi:heme exporter protein A